ncbi:MAG: FMN-binding protein [Planctomycetes bacterium]|nr:FMN-binding protein [Planctomycetota bacterium]
MRTSGSLYTICFATLLAALCGLLTGGAKKYLKPHQDRHMDAVKAKAMLEVMGLKIPANSGELAETYNRHIMVTRYGDLDIYERIVPETRWARRPQVVAWAVPFAGQGYINRIEGLISFDLQKQTIKDIVFTSISETPGLGMKANLPEFRARFRGISIDAIYKADGVKLVKPGTARQPNEIDAIAGASMTSKSLERMINEAFMRIMNNPACRGEGGND